MFNNKEEIIEKAKELDAMFPLFFNYAKENQVLFYNKMLNELEEGDSIVPYDASFDTILYNEWFNILNKYYPEQLKTTSLDDLFVLSELLDSNLHNYNKGNEKSEIETNLSFGKIVEKFEWYFVLSKFQSIDTPDIDRWEHKNRWEFQRNTNGRNINFATDDECWEIPCDENLMKKSMCFGTTRISRHNVQFDYSLKCAGLYQGIICSGIEPNKQKIWISDFINLTELLIRGKYKIDDNVFVIDELSWTEDDSEDDVKYAYSDARSYQTCVIYFLNYILNKNEEAFLKFARLILLTAENVFESFDIDPDVFNLDEKDIILKTIKLIDNFFNDCKKKNSCNMKLNCLPEYHITARMSPVLIKSYYQDAPFADEMVQKYTEIPSEKEEKCAKIACMLVEAGYDRDEKIIIDTYVEKYKKYRNYRLLYRKLYKLGLAQELLYLLNDSLYINTNLVEDVPSIKRICSRIQDYLYEEKDDAKVEKELDNITGKSFEFKSTLYELETYKQFVSLLDMELSADLDLDSLLQLKHSFAVRILNRIPNEDKEKIAEFSEINDKILSMIEFKSQEDNLFETVENEINALFEKHESDITRKIIRYLGSDSLDCSTEFKSIKRALTTAEFLYKRYVLPYAEITKNIELPDKIQNMDFSCIALEYYTALERLANLLLYKPYKEKVLTPWYSSHTRDDFDIIMSGYVGDVLRGNLVAGRNLKNSLELGTLAHLYKDSITNNRIKSNYQEIGNYISQMSLRMAKAEKYGKKIFDISKLRNMSAHVDVLDICYAKKAQDVSLNHSPSPDASLNHISLANQCHKMMIELLAWFAS